MKRMKESPIQMYNNKYLIINYEKITIATFILLYFPLENGAMTKVRISFAVNNYVTVNDKCEKISLLLCFCKVFIL